MALYPMAINSEFQIQAIAFNKCCSKELATDVKNLTNIFIANADRVYVCVCARLFVVNFSFKGKAINQPGSQHSNGNEIVH